MTDKLIFAMSHDMKILPYFNEKDEDYICRVLYSALGLWSLNIVNSKNQSQEPCSKSLVSRRINELVQAYKEIYPNSAKFFDESEVNSANHTVGEYIRYVYESLGYLIEKESGLVLAKYGRGLDMYGDKIYFGLPTTFSSINGLAICKKTSYYNENILDVLVRDNLNCLAYIKNQYDIVHFEKWCKDGSALQFFNPLAHTILSSAWSNTPATKYSIARNLETNDYYRVICNERHEIEYYSLETKESDKQKQSVSGFEFRRLYYALKAFYDNPSGGIAIKLDERYYKLILFSRLPNREQTFLSLVAWPNNNFFNKTSFIVSKNVYLLVQKMLGNIGIQLKEKNDG